MSRIANEPPTASASWRDDPWAMARSTSRAVNPAASLRGGGMGRIAERNVGRTPTL
jgi:hypothetical protein